MIRSFTVAAGAALGLFFFACSSDTDVPAAPPESGAVEEAVEAVPSEEVEEAESKTAEPREILARLGAKQGKVLINRKPAELDQELAPGDVIVTRGGRSHADIYMTDNSRVRLGPNARLEFSEAGQRVSVKLLLGKLYSWITPGTSYDVTTSSAVAGVRGTKFFVEEKRNKSYYCVCEGTIAVKAERSEEEVLLEAGDDLYVKRKKAGEPQESSATMIDGLNSVFDELGAAAEADSEEGDESEEGEKPAESDD